MTKMLVLPEGPYKRLKRSRATALFLVGFLLSIGCYGAFKAHYKHQIHQQEIEVRDKTIEELKDEIEGLETVKQEYALRVKKASDFILKTNPKLSQEVAIQYAKWEIKYAAKYGVPLSVGLAISKKESAWEANAVSPTGPVGVKQIGYSHWKTFLGLKDPSQLLNPKTNIEGGYRIYAHLRNKYGDKALERYYGSLEPTENKAYAASVLRVASNY